MGTFSGGYMLDPATGRPAAARKIAVESWPSEVPVVPDDGAVATGPLGGYPIFNVAGHDVLQLRAADIEQVIVSIEKQLELAKALAGLLSPEPGSLILGAHGGRPEKGERIEYRRPNSHGNRMFCHSPESWIEIWDGQVFRKGTVKVDARLVEVERRDLDQLALAEQAKFYLLVWSVTRL